jgi:hypothetical protein
MSPPTTCATSKKRGYMTLPMTRVEEIFWTSKGVADVARKVQVPLTCVRANHFYIYKWLYMHTKLLINKYNNSEKPLWLILVFRL